MGIKEELEAIRRAGGVKAKSDILSTQVGKNGFTSPETEAELFKQKSLAEKRSRLEAQNSMRRGGQGAAHMNMLYKKLITDQREKRRDAERNLREWKKVYKGATGGSGPPPPMPAGADEDEDSMNREALEMLPEHVVSALKEKYETNDAALALSQALNDESDHGKGELATLMEVGSPRAADGVVEDDDKPSSLADAPFDESNEKMPAEDNPPLVVVAAAIPEEDIVAEEKKVEETEPANEHKNEAQTEQIKEEPVGEARVKVETLRIEEPPPKFKPNLSHITNTERIAQTKRFYNTHSQEYIHNISSRLATLTPTTHRDKFITHMHLQQYLSTNDVITMIDLGCGFGRDVLHFTTMGHSVLGVDYSVKMLEHARTLAPKAHYLNMDMRDLGNVLVDESVDGVWASASLTHLPKCEVLDVLKGLHAAVKVGGVLYLSVKMVNDDKIVPDTENTGEVFEADERYTMNDDHPPLQNDKDEVYDDTRNKLYSYYTHEEATKFVFDAGWDIVQIGVTDQQEISDYVQHRMLHVFAIRKESA